MIWGIERWDSKKTGDKLKDTPEDMFVEGVPASKLRAIREGGKALVSILREKEGISITDEEAEIVERVCVVAMAIDFFVDEKSIPTSKMARIVSEENSAIPSLNKALARVRSLIEQHGDYHKYVSDAARALSYSGKDTIQDRHREALYLGRALTSAIRRDSPDKKHLEEVIKRMVSISNFFDDVIDYETDGKDIQWMQERRRAAMRAFREFYKVTDNPRSYWLLTSALIFTMHGRRLIPGSLNLLGMK